MAKLPRDTITHYGYDAKGNINLTITDLIRCKDCKWYDRYDDRCGYCLAAEHGYMSSHWDISIRRTYEEDFYCADAERRTDG